MTHDQRYRPQEFHQDRPERPLDVYNHPESSWTRFDYNRNKESKSDGYRYRNVDRSRGYGNWRLLRGYSRGRYRGEEKGRQDRGRGYWNKRGQYTYNKMQGKRPCDVTVDRHEKKRRLNLTESSLKDNFESRSHGGRKSPFSRESSRSADAHRYRESSKDRKVMLSGKSDYDRIHSIHSSKTCKRTADSTSEHSTMERLGAETERSKSKEGIMTSELNFTSELSKQKTEEEKKKEKTGCENAMVSVSSTTCTSVLKSMDKVLTSNTKSVSKRHQFVKPTSKCENLPVVHTKPKLSLKTSIQECNKISSVNKSPDTSVKGMTFSGMSSNSEVKKVLPKIKKIPSSKIVCVNEANSGSSKNVSSVNGTKESSKKQHHRHSLGIVPLQPSKKPLSSGISLDKKQQNKRKHRHSSGHVTKTSPKHCMVVSKTSSEVTDCDVDHDASLNLLLLERDESLPHLVHKKRHKRMSGSISPPRNTAVEAGSLFHDDGICGKEDSKKTSKTVEKEENQISKTTSGKENVEQSSFTMDKNLSKSSSVKSHEKHKLKGKCYHKETILHPKEKDISVKSLEKEKVNDAAKKELSLKKLHTKHVQDTGRKKNKLAGSHKKEGTRKELSSKRAHDQSSVCMPVMSVKKVSSEVKRDQMKTLERAEVGSSMPSAVLSNKDSVPKSDRMSLFDLFKDSSDDQPQHKPSNYKLSVKRTPNSKHSKRSPTKSNTELEKSHHSKRKIEDKPNKVVCKKTKVCYSEEVISSELGNMCSDGPTTNISKSFAVSEKSNIVCDTVDSEMEKVVSSSTSSCPTTQSDILSFGPSEKDLSNHDESDVSINSSGRHMDESGSACTSFSLSSCMTSPSFNKSDTFLSDNGSEMETSSNMSKLKSERSVEIQPLASKNLDCDSSKNVSLDLCDKQESHSMLDHASESEDDGSDRLVIDLNYTSVPLVDTTAGDTTKNEPECFKLPQSKHEKNSNQQKQKEKQSDQHTTSNDDYESSQDEMMDVNMNDFVDKDDIRFITYNEGDIESPWTPMPATPYVSNLQEDDLPEDGSLSEENSSSSINEGEDIAADEEKEVNSVQEKETISYEEKEIDSRQEKETISYEEKEIDSHQEKETISYEEKEIDSRQEKETISYEEKEINSHQEKETNLHKEAEIRQSIDNEKENNQDQERDKNPNKEKETDIDQTRVTSQDHGCSSEVEQLEQKASILASLPDVRLSSDADSRKEKEYAASSNECVTWSSEKKSADEITTFPETIKQEPVSLEDFCITKNIPHSKQIRGAGIIRSSSADHLTLQNHESSKPLIMRSQSVGGESNQSVLGSCQAPNISLDALPPCAVDAGTKVPTVSTPASGSDAYTTISDSYTAAHINHVVSSGKLTAEQHEFMAKIDKSLDLLSALGCSSMKIPLKHDKFFTDGSEFTSFGNFSPKHLTYKNMMRCIECTECLETMSPREFIEHLCGSVQHKQFDMEKLVRTTFEFCTNQHSSSDTCGRVLLIIIFKLERSLYRSFKEGSACQTVLSPTDDTPVHTISPCTTKSSVETTACVKSPAAQEIQQPALSGLSSVETSLTTNLPSGIAQSSSLELPTPQEKCPPTTQMIEESISKSLAVEEYLSNIQRTGASQPPRKGMDKVMSANAWSQGSGQHPLTECTTQVSGQSLQQNVLKSVAPLAGIGQLPVTSTTGFSISEIEQLSLCLQQPAESLQKSSTQLCTNNDPSQSGLVLPQRLSKNVMENQRMQYHQDRVKNSVIMNNMPFENLCVGQLSLPDSRVNKLSTSQTYQGSGGVRNRTRRGSAPPQTRPSNDLMPTTCSPSSSYQGQLSSMSNVQSRMLGNIDSELAQATNTFQSCPYSIGQVTSRSSVSQYQTNTSSRLGMNENFTNVGPQGFSKQVGYMSCLMNTGLNADTATSNNFGSGVNVGPFNRMGAHAPMAFQNNFGPQSMLGPQCNNTMAPHSTLGSTGTSEQYRNVIGPLNSSSHGTTTKSMLGLHSSDNEGSVPRNTLQQSTCRPSNTTGLHYTSNPHGTSKTKSNSASGQQQSSSAVPSNPTTNSSASHDKFSTSVQENFWVSLGDKIHNESHAYHMFIMGQMMQRKAVEWFRDTLQETRYAMEKMDKDHKEEMRKRKESEENVTKRFNSFKTLVETYTKKHNDNS